MLIFNLSVLLAERNLKINKVSKDTGISRTTLTSLAKNHAQGIQFETVNTLCLYLNVSPSDLMKIHPVDFRIEEAKASLYNERVKQDTTLKGSFIIRIKAGLKYYVVPFNTYTKSLSDINVPPVTMHCGISFTDSASLEAEAFRKYYAELPVIFKSQLNTNLFDELESVAFPLYCGEYTISNLDEAIRQL